MGEGCGRRGAGSCGGADSILSAAPGRGDGGGTERVLGGQGEDLLNMKLISSLLSMNMGSTVEPRSPECQGIFSEVQSKERSESVSFCISSCGCGR